MDEIVVVENYLISRLRVQFVPNKKKERREKSSNVETENAENKKEN